MCQSLLVIYRMGVCCEQAEGFWVGLFTTSHAVSLSLDYPILLLRNE